MGGKETYTWPPIRDRSSTIDTHAFNTERSTIAIASDRFLWPFERSIRERLRRAVDQSCSIHDRSMLVHVLGENVNIVHT